MTGNAWQWVADWYRVRLLREPQAGHGSSTTRAGPADSYDPEDRIDAAGRAQARDPRRLVPLQRGLLPELPAERAPRQ